VFKPTVSAVPNPESGGVPIVLNGVDGDTAVVGFQFPNSENSSEELDVTEKNISEIKAGLDKLEIEQWEFLTKLPSSIFRFDVILSSYQDSPNKAKKASYYFIKDSNGIEYKVLPGGNIILIKSSKIEDLSYSLSGIQIKLIYEHGLYQNFYNEDGELVSQATGELIIKPTILLQILIILGIWASIVTFLMLAKQTLMSSQDLKEVIIFFKNNNN